MAARHGAWGALLLAGLVAGMPARAAEAPRSVPSEDDLLAEELEVPEPPGADDPLEPLNRITFCGNRLLDRWLLNPIVRAYARVMPDPAERGVRNVFENLNAPVVFANDLLQLEPRRAAQAAARFILNTTLGVGGLFDLATRAGLPKHEADFGQTLGRAGIGPGAYLVLPLAGPTTLRDAIGQLVDTALRPDTWILSPGGRLVLSSTGGVSRKEETLEDLEALERSSVDFYITLRDAYLMHRQALIDGADQ